MNTTTPPPLHRRWDQFRVHARLAAPAAALVLAACSGGGGGQASSSGRASSAATEPTPSAWITQLTTRGTLTRFVADGSTGELFPEGHLVDFPFVVPSDLVAAKDGEVLYVMDAGTGRLNTVRIDPRTGGLAVDGFVTVPSGAGSLAIDSHERFVFVQGSGEITAVRVDPATYVPTVGATTPASNDPFRMMVEPTGRFLYQISLNPRELRAFSIAPGDGTLTEIDMDAGSAGVNGVPLAAGTLAHAVDPLGRFVFTSTNGEATCFGIDSASGVLAELSTASSGATTTARDAATTFGGEFLYVTHGEGAIATYAVDPDTGTLTHVDANALIGGEQNTTTDVLANTITLAPTGKHVYVTHDGHRLAIMELDSTNGLPVNPKYRNDARIANVRRTISAPRQSAPLRGPRFLFVAGSVAGVQTVDTYIIDPATGDLSFSDTVQGVARSRLMSDRAHRYLYSYDGDVTRFEIDHDAGRLLAPTLVHQPGSGSASVRRAVVNPSGFAIHAADIGGPSPAAFNSYNSGIGGADVVPLGNMFASSSGAVPVANGFSLGDVAVDPVGHTAFYSGALALSVHPINETVVVQPKLDADPGTAGHQDFDSGINTGQLELDPFGRFLFGIAPGQILVDDDEFLSSYTIAVDGALSRVDQDAVAAGTQRISLSSSPDTLSVDPRGSFVYVGLASEQVVAAFVVDSLTGRLSPIDADGTTAGLQHFPLPGTGANRDRLSIEPSGRFLYAAVLQSGAPTILRYEIDRATGALTDLTVAATPPAGFALLATGWFE